MSSAMGDSGLSIVQGPALEDEPGIGALTLGGYLHEVTARFGPREAACIRAGDATIRWTYATLWDRSVEVARALLACGTGKGTRVGVLMTNRLEFLSSFFGAALAGATPVALSTFSTPAELDHLLAASCCSVVLLERQVLKKDFAAMLAELEPAIAASNPGAIVSHRFPYLHHCAMLDDEGLGAIEPWAAFLARGVTVDPALVDSTADAVSSSDPGALFFSSGSTAKPKGILSAHRGVALQLWRMARQQGLEDGVRCWSANGFFWSGNFAMAIGGTFSAGGCIVLQQVFNAEEALALMEAERVSFLFAWPHQWEQLVAAPNWHSVDLSALRHIDPESPIARHPSVRTSWIEPRHCYGNTETFTLSTGFPANTSREVAGNSHGRPFPGNTLKIVDPLTGAAVPIGARGEVAIKGPTLMLGYLGIPLDETLDDEGFFRTGDGGFVDVEGRLHWEGRLNDIIKTGGANVSPLEIDAVLAQCPGVKMVQTVGVPHDTLGEIVVACIVPHEAVALNEAEVRDFARAQLASYKVPRRALFFAGSELQLTGSAKIKTAELRQLAAARLG